MKIIVDPTHIDHGQWEALARRSTVSNIFQTREMYAFYTKLNLYPIKVFAVEEGGTLRGLLVCMIQGEGRGLRRRITSRAIINGGPLLDDIISDKALELLLTTAIIQLKRECIYIETRNLNDYSRWKDVFIKSGYNYIAHNNFHVDTTSIEIVNKKMDSNRRRCIRRATENNAVFSTDIVYLPDFYNILKDLYHTKVHKPLPPYTFFEELATESYVRYFFVLSPQNEVIGGHLTLILDNRVIYSWYCCGLDRKYHNLYPSIMANYAAISYATKNGIARYDMMGAGTPDKKYGVRDFKSQFGGTLVEHGRFLHVCSPIIYNSGKAIMNLLNNK